MADVFTVPEAAARLGVSRRTIDREIAAGRIRAVRIRGRVLVPRAEIERVLGTDLQTGDTMTPTTLASLRVARRAVVDALAAPGIAAADAGELRAHLERLDRHLDAAAPRTPQALRASKIEEPADAWDGRSTLSKAHARRELERRGR